MPLQTASLTQVAHELQQPFTLRPLASVGHLVVSVFVCQGGIEWHKHLDEDELFLVHEGVISLDTERGNLNLHAEELAVVPKGLMHRSQSMLRSTVVLIRPTGYTERTNGHRHFYTVAGEPSLEKVRLAQVAPTAMQPFQLMALAQVENYEVLLAMGRGIGPEETAPDTGALWLVVRGDLRIETTEGDVTLVGPGELTVIPADTRFRFICPQPALLLTLAKT
jgi:mannose-6-phosphate isomerase-like protein (cupin superfamily)